MSSIIEAIRYLGPAYCAISIVEGRSDDGTYEVLADLKMHVEALGAQFFLSTSTINPKAEGEDRIKRLSQLRNKALWPLKASAATGPINELACHQMRLSFSSMMLRCVRRISSNWSFSTSSKTRI